MGAEVMIQQALEAIKDILIDVGYFIANAIIEALAALVGLAAAMLPTWSPGSVVLGSPASQQVLAAINWVVPIGVLVDCLGFYALSVTTWFTIGIVTRWAKISS